MARLHLAQPPFEKPALAAFLLSTIANAILGWQFFFAIPVVLALGIAVLLALALASTSTSSSLTPFV